MIWVFFILVLAILGALAYFLLASSTAPARPERSTKPIIRDCPPGEQLQRLRDAGVFTGILVEHAGCAASASLEGKKFPIQQAPKLPLRDCDQSECTCLYAGLGNRRMPRERRSGRERRQSFRLESDRREGADRRHAGSRERDVWDKHDD